MSAEFPLGATPGPSTMEPASQQTPSSRQHAHGGASAPSQPVAEAHVPFLRLVSLHCLRSQFAELLSRLRQTAVQILTSVHNFRGRVTIATVNMLIMYWSSQHAMPQPWHSGHAPESVHEPESVAKLQVYASVASSG